MKRIENNISDIATFMGSVPHVQCDVGLLCPEFKLLAMVEDTPQLVIDSQKTCLEDWNSWSTNMREAEQEETRMPDRRHLLISVGGIPHCYDFYVQEVEMVHKILH